MTADLDQAKADIKAIKESIESIQSANTAASEDLASLKTDVEKVKGDAETAQSAASDDLASLKTDVEKIKGDVETAQSER